MFTSLRPKTQIGQWLFLSGKDTKRCKTDEKDSPMPGAEQE